MSRNTEDEPRLTRREFLGSTAKKLGEGGNPLLPPAQPLPDLFRNEERVQLPGGATVRVFYGKHRIPEDHHTLEGATAVVLEMPVEFGVGAGPSLDLAERVNQFKPILEEAKRRRIPVFFIDMSFQELNDVGVLQDFAISNFLVRLEACVGLGLNIGAVLRILNPERQREPVAKRSFEGLTLIALGTYLLTPAAENVSRALADRKIPGKPNVMGKAHQATRTLRAFNEQAHPELLRKNPLREAYMAQLTIQVLRSLADSGEETLVANMYVGAAHTGIADWLKDSEEARMKLIRRKSGPVALVGMIARLDFLDNDEVKVTVFSDPAFQQTE